VPPPAPVLVPMFSGAVVVAWRTAAWTCLHIHWVGRWLEDTRDDSGRLCPLFGSSHGCGLLPACAFLYAATLHCLLLPSSHLPTFLAGTCWHAGGWLCLPRTDERRFGTYCRRSSVASLVSGRDVAREWRWHSPYDVSAAVKQVPVVALPLGELRAFWISNQVAILSWLPLYSARRTTTPTTPLTLACFCL